LKWLFVETSGRKCGNAAWPFAVSAGAEEPDPESATVEAANFEVVEPADVPYEKNAKIVIFGCYPPILMGADAAPVSAWIK